MDGKATGIVSEVGEAKEIAGEAKDEAKDIASAVKEATDWVVQMIVLTLCGGFLTVVLGILLLMLAFVALHQKSGSNIRSGS